MSSEIVKYRNELGRLKIGGVFSRPEINIFYSIISRIRNTQTIIHTNKGDRIDTKPITLTYRQIKRLSGIHYGRNLKRFENDLIHTQNKMLHLSMYHNDTHDYTAINLFSIVHINKDKHLCQFKINPDFSGLVNEITKNFTRFSLHQLVGITSTYAQNMFRYIKRFRTSGFVIISMKKLRRLLGIPKSYSGNQVNNRVITPIEVELTPLIKGLHVIKVKRYGNKIWGYKMYFKPESHNQDDFSHGKKADLKREIENVKLNDFLRPSLKRKALKHLLPHHKPKHEAEPMGAFNRTLKQASLPNLTFLYRHRNTPLTHFSYYQKRKLHKRIKELKAKEN